MEQTRQGEKNSEAQLNHEFAFNSSDDSDNDEAKQQDDESLIRDEVAPTLKKLHYTGLRFNDIFDERSDPSILLTKDEAMPLIKGQNSLLPDMKFGWKPEVKTSHPPIPLYFDFVEHNLSIYNFGEEVVEVETDTLVYQGQRFVDSYKMHKQYANSQVVNGHPTYKFNFPKNHEGGRFVDDGFVSKIFGTRNLERGDESSEFVGMNPECKEANKAQPSDKEHKYLIFDGNFESGNLDLVVKSHQQSNSYDIFLRPDTNTSGYFQWFFFRVQNKLKGTKVKLNIINLTKRNSLYQQGMPVQVLSIKKAQEQGITWAFGGENVKYGISKLMRNQACYGGDEQMARRRIYFQLGWEYTFEYDEDTVYFAYSLPYTFTMVNNLVLQIQDQQDKIIQDFRKLCKDENFNDPSVTENNFKVVETQSITTSLAGIEVPVLTITDFSHSKYEEERKKVIIVTGRVHPGESNSSWIVHGMIKFLLSQDKVAVELRKKLIFKIIPMVNADGVVVGNSRCCMVGKDMNRMFGHPNKQLAPEPFAMRQLVRDLLKIQSHKILSYLDVHAHSQKKSIFMYGPYFPLHSSKYLKIRAIPKLVSERTEMFRFFSCKFKFEKYKEHCARLAIWRDFGITHTFTIETSSFGFLNKKRDTIHFNTGLLQEFGECMIHSIFEFNLIQEEDRKMKIELAKKLKEQRKTRKLTIAEILSRANMKENHQSAGLFRRSPQHPHRQPIDNAESNQNPNEPNDELVNLEIRPMSLEQQEQIIQANAGLDVSMDSDGWGDSSSSSSNHEDDTKSPLGKASAFNNEQQNIDVLNSRYQNVEFRTKIVSGKVQDFLNRKKGLDVPDGEELFHKLYNPFYTEWLMRRKEYIKYEQLVKLQKKSNKRYNSRPQNDNDINQDDLRPEASLNAEDFKQRQRDHFYMKEIRTFDEVFKAIKKEEVKNRQKRKLAQQNNQPLSEDEEDRDGNSDYEEDEIDQIPENMQDDLDDQDIDESDRQVLNERILGIINVFQNLSQAQGSIRKFPQKQLRTLQDLAKKALSIEKKHQPSPLKSPKQKLVPTKHQDLYQLRKQEEPRRAPGGNPLGAINYLNQASNHDLIIRNTTNKQRNFNHNSYKKKRQQFQIANSQELQSAQKATKCNIYNIGIIPIQSESLQQHKQARMKGGKYTNKLNYIRHNIELVDSQQISKNLHRLPHFFSSQSSAPGIVDKNFSPSQQQIMQQISSDYGSSTKKQQNINRDHLSRMLMKNQSTNQFVIDGTTQSEITTRQRPSFTMSSQQINSRMMSNVSDFDPQMAQIQQQPTLMEQQQIYTLSNFQLEQQIKAKQAYFNAQIAKATGGGQGQQALNQEVAPGSRPLTGNFNTRKISRTDVAQLGRPPEPDTCNSLIRKIINDTEMSIQQTSNRRLNTAKKRLEQRDDQRIHNNFQHNVLQGVSVSKSSAKKKFLSPVHNSQQLNQGGLMNVLNPQALKPHHYIYKLDPFSGTNAMMPSNLPHTATVNKKAPKSQTICKPQRQSSQKMYHGKESSRVQINNQIYIIDHSSGRPMNPMIKGSQIHQSTALGANPEKQSASIFLNSGIMVNDLNGDNKKLNKHVINSRHRIHKQQKTNQVIIHRSMHQNGEQTRLTIPAQLIKRTDSQTEEGIHSGTSIAPGDLYRDRLREPRLDSFKLDSVKQNKTATVNVSSQRNFMEAEEQIEIQARQLHIKLRRDKEEGQTK